MTIRHTLATARRVLAQLGHDRRTLALLIVVPSLLMLLLKYTFNNSVAFNHAAPLILGIIPLLMMFLITSIVTLRERTSGTLNRLMTMPVSRLDVILGYALAFSLVGLVQAVVVASLTLSWLGLTVVGGVGPILVAAIAAALLGTSLGLCVSALATTEFQAVELVMPIVMPQVLLCGLFVARDNMATALRLVSDVLPLTYGVDAMSQAAFDAAWSTRYLVDIGIMFGCSVVALAVAAASMRRRT